MKCLHFALSKPNYSDLENKVLSVYSCRCVLAVATLIAAVGLQSTTTSAVAQTADSPTFHVDLNWPKPLPNNWVLGGIFGMTTDDNGHIWVNHFTGTLGADTLSAQRGAISEPKNFAPSILEFDAEGNLIQGWDGSGVGYDWPTYPHGLFVDHKGFVWIAGHNQKDGQVLKFTRDGKFIMQIGHPNGQPDASNTSTLNRPSTVYVDPQTNELYVADGYGNRRIIVFDAESGDFKRMWGAYGNAPVNPLRTALDNFNRNDPHDPLGQPPQHFNSPVHCVYITHDRLVYVCDRTNNRVQVFHTDGTFVREFFFDRTPPLGAHITDLALWPDDDHSYLIAADSNKNLLRVVRRQDGKVLSQFGETGKAVGQFDLLHWITIDQQGNLYTGDAVHQKRLLKWIPDQKPAK